MRVRTLLVATLVAASFAPAARAADQVKLGLLLSLSGPLALVGAELQRGFDLAMAELGGKLGGLPVKLSVGDDKAVPAEGITAASKFIDEDKVDIVTGLNTSNVLLAVAPAFIDAKIIMVGALAGPNDFAGKSCSPYVFVTSFDNDDWDMVMGKYETEKGFKSVYFIGQDYQAGWEHIAAAQRTFKGKVAAPPVFVPLAAVDFATDLAQLRAAKPDAVHAFMVGNGGIAFIKQYAQAGLQDIPLFGTDAMSTPLQWPALGDATVGMTVGTNWSYEFDNPENKKFVAAYRAKYNGRPPAIFAALQYDAVMLIDAAVRDAKGKVEDHDALRAGLRKADFHSIRGAFKFNNNQYPINDLYVEQVVRDAKGGLGFALKGRAAEAWQDPYHQDCAMK